MASSPTWRANSVVAADDATGPGHRPQRLRRLPRLRDELQGMEYLRRGRAAGRPEPLRRRADGHLLQSRPDLRGRRVPRYRDRPFPQVLPALRGSALRPGLSDRSVLQAQGGRHRPRRLRQMHRLQILLVGLSLWCPRVRRAGQERADHRRRHRLVGGPTMHPAFSVVFLTTLIGVGQGLFLALFTAQSYALFGLLPVQDGPGFYARGSLVALLFLGAGLVASFLCTAMIYACLRFLREWHSPLTVINYTLLGGASGFTLATGLAALAAPQLTRFYAGWALIFTLLGLLGRAASLWRNARLKPKSTPQSAIGVKHPKVVQKAQGFMGGSFNTREFFHGKSVVFMTVVRWFFLLAAFAAPVPLLVIGSETGAAALAAAFLAQYVGLLAERWFFFAQANHPQNLYYR